MDIDAISKYIKLSSLDANKPPKMCCIVAVLLFMQNHQCNISACMFPVSPRVQSRGLNVEVRCRAGVHESRLIRPPEKK